MNGDLKALRGAVLELHAALLEAEKRQYERDHGRIESSGYALKLAIEHPSFAWIRPLAEFIVALDELEDADEPADASAIAALPAALKSLVSGSAGDFATRYREVLQESPEAVVAHGRVVTLLAGYPQTPT